MLFFFQFLFSNGSQDRFTIQANRDEDGLRIDSIRVDGDCSWEIESNEGDVKYLQPGINMDIPTNFYMTLVVRLK